MKGCNKKTKWCNQEYNCGEIEDLKHSDHIIYCDDCKLKLKKLISELENLEQSHAEYTLKGRLEILELKDKINKK